MKPPEPERPDSLKKSNSKARSGGGCVRPFLGMVIGALIGTGVTILVLKTNGSSDPLNQTMAPLWGLVYGAPIGATVGFLIASIVE